MLASELPSVPATKLPEIPVTAAAEEEEEEGARQSIKERRMEEPLTTKGATHVC